MSELCGHCRSVVNPGARVCVGCGAIRKAGLTGSELFIVAVALVTGFAFAGNVLEAFPKGHYLLALKYSLGVLIILAVVAWLVRRAQKRVLWHRHR